MTDGRNYGRELREWIRAAEAARPTCLNALEFDVLIRHQKQRLEEALSRAAVAMSENIRKGSPDVAKHVRPAIYYSDDALKEMKAEYQTVDGKLNHLIEKYFLLALRNSRAKEFATQGYPRRLKVMVRCIDNVFGMIPPDRAELPSRDELSDATINIQSFVFNVFGSIDNLAWIWVCEKGQKRSDGTRILDTHIGLGPKNESVRATLSKEFQNYLTGLDKWFVHIADLRHALAHRIPLYIPPYVIQAADEAAYKDFEAKMSDAIKKHDFAVYDQLSAEQMKLGRFRPAVWPLAARAQQPQKVVLYEADPRDSAGISYIGSAVWRTEVVPPGPGQKPNIAARADIELPARNISIRWSLRRNDDKQLPASHIVEIVFTLPPDFPHGGISNIPGVLMKQGETMHGVPLNGVAVKVTTNFFLIGLSSVDADMQRNIELLIEGSWFDIPVVYGDGKRAIIAIEKGTPGERAFADALGDR